MIDEKLSRILRKVVLFNENDPLEKQLINEIKELFENESVPVEKLVSPIVMLQTAEIDKMLKQIEEYFDTPNYKNNVVEYKSYYDGAFNYLRALKNILVMKSGFSA